MMVRAKICGVCRPEDARAAAAAGADYIGIILAPGHVRSQSSAEADEIYSAVDLPRVGVFVDPLISEVCTAATRHRLHAVQLHGSETVAFVRELRHALSDAGARALVWKAVRVRTSDDVVAHVEEWNGVADGMLLDGWSPRAQGGAGVRFDWDSVAAALHGRARMCSLIVAGGLTPENVVGVIRTLSPDVVDVSSGVEEEVGRKSPELMRAFIAAATSTAASQHSPKA